ADTSARPFTVSSGNYSSRFAVTVASAVHVAAVRLADRVRAIAADMLECAAGDVELADGTARVIGSPDRSVSVRRIAGAAHWDPAGLPGAGSSVPADPGVDHTGVTDAAGGVADTAGGLADTASGLADTAGGVAGTAGG